MIKRICLLLLIAYLPLAFGCSEGAGNETPASQPAPSDNSVLKNMQKAAGTTEFSIDDVNGKTSNTQPLVFGQHDLAVGGWAIDEAAGTAASGVFVVVDGKYFKARYGISRPDVAETLGSQAYTDSGFSAVIPAGSLEKGNHSVGIVVLNANRSQYYDIPPTRFISLLIQ